MRTPLCTLTAAAALLLSGVSASHAAQPAASQPASPSQKAKPSRVPPAPSESLTNANAAKASSTPASPVPLAEESLVGARYVAIGSSFAAGPQLPPAKPSWPARCGQSFNNYPSLLAERFDLVLIDRSCSGAMTQNVLGPWNEIPPQINSVTPETRLVTVTIGGNDLSYIGNLFSATCAFNAKKTVAAGGTPKPCGALRVPTEADYERDEAQLNEIARRLKTMAPRARIVFVQYLTPLPRAGGLCAATTVSETDASIVREIGVRLSEITKRVAQTNDVMLVEMDRASATHTPCDSEPWMIGSPQGYDGRQGLQWHLNKAGMEASAEHIVLALIKSGVRPAKPKVILQPSAPTTRSAATAKPTNRTVNTRAKPIRRQNRTTPSSR